MTALSTATRRAERFFAEVAEEFGTRSGEIVTIPMRQCELARRKAMAASTVAAHVRAMGERVLQRRPMIVITDGRAQASSNASTAAKDRQADLVDALNDVVQAQQRLIDLLMKSATAPSRIIAESRGIVADPVVQGTSRSQVSKEEPFLLPDDERFRDDSRGNVADPTHVEDPRAWSLEDLDRVLGPLHNIVRDRGLKPMNNRASLAASLADLALTEIDAAVHRLMTMTASGSVTSPFGLLVSWARRNESQMFIAPPETLLEPPAVAKHAEDEVADMIDAEASRTIALWETHPERYAEQLEAIDHQIVLDNGAIPLIDTVEPLRHAFRVEALTLRLRRAMTLFIHDGASANAHVSAPPLSH